MVSDLVSEAGENFPEEVMIELRSEGELKLTRQREGLSVEGKACGKVMLEKAWHFQETKCQYV